MPVLIRVRAVPGRMYPSGAPGQFIGYRQATADTPEADIVHQYGNGGPAYVLAGDVDVESTVETRRAIADGDSEFAAPNVKPAAKPAAQVGG